MKSHTFLVFAYELRRNLRRKGYLFTTFGIPLIAVALLLGYLFINSQNTGTADTNPTQTLADQFNFQNVGQAGYVDESGLLGDPGDLSALLKPYADETAAQAAMGAGEIPFYYLIPADYLQTGDVTLVQPRFNMSQIEDAPLRRLLLNTLSKGVDPQVFQRLVNPSNLQQTNLALTNADSGSQNEGSTFIVVYIFAIALMLSLFATNGYLMQSVIEEKETRLIEILISTVRPGQLLVGKILALGLLGLLQITVWVGSMYLVTRWLGGETLDQTLSVLVTLANIKLPLDILPLLLVYFVLAYFMFAGFYSIIGALSNSLREGPQYAVIFTLPAVLPLYFLALFTTEPNGTIPVILSIFPLTAPLAMTQRLVISNVPGWEVGVSVVLLALTAGGIMWLAGRLFRVQVLLAGQMPKLRDVPRLLRG